MEAAFQLAQVNIARMRAPLDDAAMDGFTSRIAEINHLAESSPGFVWRWTGSDNGPYNAPDLLFNLSVWESIDALRSYVYRSPHVELFRGRSDWFLPPTALRWPFGGSPPAIGRPRKRANSALTVS
jgi:hypothetical protein